MSAEPMAEADLVIRVQFCARELCAAIRASQEAGADAIVYPALIAVFREEGFFPQDLDLGSLMGMFR